MTGLSQSGEESYFLGSRYYDIGRKEEVLCSRKSVSQFTNSLVGFIFRLDVQKTRLYGKYGSVSLVENTAIARRYNNSESISTGMERWAGISFGCCLEYEESRDNLGSGPEFQSKAAHSNNTRPHNCDWLSGPLKLVPIQSITDSQNPLIWQTHLHLRKFLSSNTYITDRSLVFPCICGDFHNSTWNIYYHVY